MSETTSTKNGTKEVCEAFISEATSMYNYVVYYLIPIDPDKNEWEASVTYEDEDKN